MMRPKYSENKIANFFGHSDWLDRFVLRPLSHIAPNWEATWDAEGQCYEAEADSFASDLNVIIKQIANADRPENYHDNEDVLAERVIQELKWPIQKRGNLWMGADYQSILEQGSFNDVGQQNLIVAATGRVQMAMDFGQMHFDEMEDAHLNMLAAIMTISIYQRVCNGESLLYGEEDS